MAYTISYFIGDQKNTSNGETKTYETFDEFANDFSKCSKGRKHSAYFVRGELEPIHRKDCNLKQSNILVIDGDEGVRGRNAPKPLDVHNTLVELGLNHFIYTSHSHNAEQNKFRCIVPCGQYMEKKDIKANIYGLMNELSANGIRLKHVTEMNTWSQPWFVPTRDDPKDGLFEFYKYTEGKDWETLYEQEEYSQDEEPSKRVETHVGSTSLSEMYENIRTGKEYHESMLNISYQLIKDGMSKAHVIAMLETLMNGSVEAGTDRWQQRYNDIERTVQGAINKDNPEFDLESISEEFDDSDNEMPLPPGLLYDLYQCCYDGLLYQYKEVALVSSLGLVAGIAGRRFNVMTPKRTGLNLYLTIVAGTGFGKDGIGQFISRCIRNSSNGLKDSFDSFIGPSSFTGGKAITNAFENARSRVCVMSEAGLLMKVKHGDVEGKSAALLDAFNVSDSNSYTKYHTYADNDKSIPSLRAMAITIISESTPEQLMSAYSQMGALTNGYLPRQIIFKIEKRQTKINRNVKDTFDDKLANRLLELLETCAAVQAESDPKAFEMDFHPDIHDDVYDYQDSYNELAAKYEVTNKIKANMATRIGLKVVRIAALATVFNKPKSSPNCLVIEKPEWEWAKALCDYEFKNVTNALAGLSGDGEMDNAIVAVYTKMKSIIDDTIRDSKCKVDVRYRKHKVIPYGRIKIACASNPNVKSLDSNAKHGNIKTGLDKVLEYMQAQQAIEIRDHDPLGGRAAKTIKILEGMNDFMKMYSVN